MDGVLPYEMMVEGNNGWAMKAVDAALKAWGKPYAGPEKGREPARNQEQPGTQRARRPWPPATTAALLTPGQPTGATGTLSETLSASSDLAICRAVDRFDLINVKATIAATPIRMALTVKATL